jgi:ankyrin repeat protein
VEHLLDKSANPNVQNMEKMSPLHFACQYGNQESIQLLRGKGAILESRNKDQWTPLHFAAESGLLESLEAILHLGADINSKTALVKKLPSSRHRSPIIYGHTVDTVLGRLYVDKIQINGIPDGRSHVYFLNLVGT